MDRMSSAFKTVLVARIVQQDTAHDLRRNAEKMRAILPMNLLLIDKPQVGFVYQSRRLQRVIAILAPHIAVRQAMQLPFDKRQQFIQGRLIAVPPINQQTGNVSVGRHYDVMYED